MQNCNHIANHLVTDEPKAEKLFKSLESEFAVFPPLFFKNNIASLKIHYHSSLCFETKRHDGELKKNANIFDRHQQPAPLLPFATAVAVFNHLSSMPSPRISRARTHSHARTFISTTVAAAASKPKDTFSMITRAVSFHKAHLFLTLHFVTTTIITHSPDSCAKFSKSLTTCFVYTGLVSMNRSK